MAAFSTLRGMFGSPPIAPQQTEPQLPEMRRPSTLQNIAGTVGDALLQWSGGRPIFAPAQQANQQLAQQQQQAQLQRAQEFADWQRKQEWQRANPAPVNNDTIADYNFRVQALGKDAADSWLRNGPDMPVTLTLPNGQVYSGPRSGLGAALGGGGAAHALVPDKPVGKLTPLGPGGASPTGSRTFR